MGAPPASRPTIDRVRPRLLRRAAVSVVVWGAAVAAVLWHLRRQLPPEIRALPLTHADSVGLPVTAFALLLAGALAVANAVAAAILLRRRRRAPRAPGSRPAV
jgi:hypothetical protein